MVPWCRRIIASLFYREDIETHYARLQAYAEPEVLGDEWVAADPQPPQDPEHR